MIRPEQILDAIGTLDEEMVFNAKAVNNKKRRGAIYRYALIAAAMIVLMCVSASAVYLIIHQNTVELLETGPLTGGAASVEVDDRAVEVIEEKSVDYSMEVTDQGTTVTLDSIMGMATDDGAICYMTLTITPSEGVTISGDAQELGFMEIGFYPEDTTLSGSSSGTCTVVDKEDGTYSAMLLWQFYGRDITNCAMRLELGGFGDVSKERARALYSGEAEIELPGAWSFHIDALSLEEPTKLPFDETLFAEEQIHPTEIALSSYGVILTYTAEATDVLRTVGAIMQEKYPELEIDWNNLNMETLNLLRAEGSVFTDQQEEELTALLAEYSDTDGGVLKNPSFQLTYQDGSACKIGDTSADWGRVNPSGETMAFIWFDAPIAMDELASVTIGSVTIPVVLG